MPSRQCRPVPPYIVFVDPIATPCQCNTFPTIQKAFAYLDQTIPFQQDVVVTLYPGTYEWKEDLVLSRPRWTIQSYSPGTVFLTGSLIIEDDRYTVGADALTQLLGLEWVGDASSIVYRLRNAGVPSQTHRLEGVNFSASNVFTKSLIDVTSNASQVIFQMNEITIQEGISVSDEVRPTLIRCEDSGSGVTIVEVSNSDIQYGTQRGVFNLQNIQKLRLKSLGIVNDKTQVEVETPIPIIDILEKKEKKDNKWRLQYVFEEGDNGPECWDFDLIKGKDFDIVENPRLHLENKEK
jgi:hypothetical protein